jgi:hypothetical protein
MAHTLRDALKAKAIEFTHSECLELIAKTFGYDNWNILSAKIAAGSFTERSALELRRDDPHCSFCGKSQHEVRKLVAGPAVSICDGCIRLYLIHLNPIKDGTDAVSRKRANDNN